MNKKGFTLIEILVATSISAVVALVAVSTMRSIGQGQKKAEAFTELNDTCRFAFNKVLYDLKDLYIDRRGSSLIRYELIEQGQSVQPSLTFYTVSMNKVRKSQPEGDVYLVQYFIQSAGSQDTGDNGQAEPGQDVPMQVVVRRIMPVVPGLEV